MKTKLINTPLSFSLFFSFSWSLIRLLFSSPSQAPLTRGLLHFDVLIIVNASILPLPLAIFCLVRDTLHLPFGSLHIFLRFVLKNHQHSVFLLARIFISSFSPASSFSFFFFHRSVFTPSLSFIGVFLFSCSPSLLCCSMGNTGNHGEQLCNIHGDLAVVRYEPHPCLLACCGLESVEGSFCLFFLVCEQYPICMYEHVLYVSMHAHVALLIPIL